MTCNVSSATLNLTIHQSTHRDGHTLDLVITRHDTTICDLRVGGLISDHAPVYFRLCVTKRHSTYAASDPQSVASAVNGRFCV